jgi:hypothetical protein
MTYSPSQ